MVGQSRVTEHNLKRQGAETVEDKIKRCTTCHDALLPEQPRYASYAQHYSCGKAARKRDRWLSDGGNPEVHIMFLVLQHINNNKK